MLPVKRSLSASRCPLPVKDKSGFFGKRQAGSGKRAAVGVLFLLLTACNTHHGDMKADTMRAAIDNCQQNKLGVLVYQRPDQSVMDIRCMPIKGEVNHTVTIRKRANMPILRILTESIDIEEN